MATNVTEKEAMSLIKQISSLKSRVSNTKEKMEEAIGQVVQTIEVGSTAVGFGVINGRWGGVELVGVPLDLITGGVFHLIGLFGVAPDHMHNLGDGALASWLTTLGAGIGDEMRQKAGGATASGGMLPGGNARSIDQDLSRIAAAAA